MILNRSIMKSVKHGTAFLNISNIFTFGVFTT